MAEPIKQPRSDASDYGAEFDQGPQGPRRRAQAARHVYRRHRRRLRPASHGLRGRRQCDRRGARRLRQGGGRHAQPGRFVHRARRRPRRPHRHPQGRGRVGGRGHHDPAARRRKIRPELLQSVGRAARRRRLRRQRAVELSQAHHLARRQGARHGVPPRRSGRAAQRDRRRRRPAGHRGDVPALDRNLHHDRVRLGDAGASTARARLPEFGRADRAVGQTPRRREARGDALQGRRRGLREISRSQQEAARRASHRDQVGARGRRGGLRVVVERRLSRGRAVLHQQYPATRRRHASRRLSRGADAPGHELRRGRRDREKGEGRAHRRGLPRRIDRGSVRQIARSEILLPDEGQARLLGGAARGRGRDQ